MIPSYGYDNMAFEPLPKNTVSGHASNKIHDSKRSNGWRCRCQNKDCRKDISIREGWSLKSLSTFQNISGRVFLDDMLPHRDKSHRQELLSTPFISPSTVPLMPNILAGKLLECQFSKVLGMTCRYTSMQSTKIFKGLHAHTVQ